MKNKTFAAIVFVLLFSAVAVFAASEADIRDAARKLNVPEDALRNLVEMYNSPSGESAEVVKTDISTYRSDYKSNQFAADQKYKGKAVEMTVTVDSIGSSYFQGCDYTINAKDPSDEWDFLGIDFHLLSSENNKLAQVTIGGSVTVRGTGAGQFRIENAQIIL